MRPASLSGNEPANGRKVDISCKIVVSVPNNGNAGSVTVAVSYEKSEAQIIPEVEESCAVWAGVYLAAFVPETGNEGNVVSSLVATIERWVAEEYERAAHGRQGSTRERPIECNQWDELFG